MSTMKARARKSDPETSHEAAAEVEKKGKASTQRIQCLAAVKNNPGRTAAEIAAMADLERHVPSRRLPELRDAGLVETGPERKCRIMGSSAMTWYAVEREPDLFPAR